MAIKLNFKSKAPKVLDLFSGIGGFSLGLSQAGFLTTQFCEIEPHCRRVLKKNFPLIPIHKDIKTLTVSQGQYDVMCGGFPCQDISIGGKGVGIGGAKSGLWKNFRDKINEGRPKYAIIENVSAILARGLEVVLSDLAEIGYDATWTLYDSKYFGVPQRRRRVYILAVRDGIKEGADIFDFAGRSTSDCAERMELVEGNFKSHFTKTEHGRELSYFTRQRSDSFAECGVSNTLAKRDYKSATDFVLREGMLQRVSPRERLALQGFPTDWFDGCGLTRDEKFTCNGMTVPVVKHIGEAILKFDAIGKVQ